MLSRLSSPLLPISAALLLGGCHARLGVSKEDTDSQDSWSPVDTSETADTQDTEDTGVPWDEREWPEEQQMFIALAYPAAMEQLAVEMALLVMGASQQNDTTWTISHSGTDWTIYLDRSGESFTQGLLTPGAVVIYGGHSNYGMGGLYSDLPDGSDVVEVETLADFWNFGSPHVGMNLEYLQTTQAYPNLHLRDGDIATDPLNYEVPVIGGLRHPNDQGVGAGDGFTQVGTGESAYHFTYEGTPYLLVNGGADDVPPVEEQVHDVLLIKSCNSGRYYLENFLRGTVFYTEGNVYAEEEVISVDIFVKKIIQRAHWDDVTAALNEREDVYHWVAID